MSEVSDWVTGSEAYGKGRKAPLGAITDATLLETLVRYKRQVAKRYRIVEPDAIDRLLPDETLFVSPKLDGELWFLVHRGGGDVALVAYNGRALFGIAALSSLPARLKSEPAFVVAGELFVDTGTGERSRVHHVATTLGDPTKEGNVAFAAFDVVSEGDRDVLGLPYAERLAKLRHWIGEGDARLKVVRTEEANPKAIAKKYSEWVNEGTAEGLVVRSDRGLTYKIKPTSTVDAVILAYGERIVGDVRQVRELQVGLVRDDGTFQLVGSVGGGFSEEDRARWLKRLAPLEVKSSFRLANREGTLCRFVRPEVVVEVRVSDFLATDGWDVPIRRMSLSYDAADGYKPITETRTPVLLHPVLMRERTDKKVDVGSVGFTQITAYLEGQGPEEDVDKHQIVSSTIELRRVFTKVTKGETAVRKVVVIRTHKEHEGTHPPYVVFTTDFSPGRKTPLETALRTASDRASADGWVEEWLEENVKRGWEEVAPSGGAPPAPKAEPVATNASAPSDAKVEPEAAKPKRARKAEAPPEAEAPEGEPEAKPKRSRKKT